MMILTRLGSLCIRRANLSQRFVSTTRLRFSSNFRDAEHNKPLKLVEENDMDKPVPYSETKASKHLARHSREPEDNAHPLQGFIMMFSLAIFMIYFFILREENDIDDLLRRPLTDVIKDIDKTVGNVPRSQKEFRK